MSWCREYKLIQENGEFVALLYLNIGQNEFSDELFESIQENIIDAEAGVKKFIKEKLPNIKISNVKLIVGALIVGTMSFMPHCEVKAVNSSSATHQSATTNKAIIKVDSMGTVKATRLNVRAGASMSNAVIHKLPKGSRVKVKGILNGWCEIQLSDGRMCWVSKRYVSLDIQSISRVQRITKVVSTAKSLRGTPYVWGGDSKADGGFDCSGFVQYAFKSIGYRLNRVSVDQSKQGRLVSRAKLQAGDLVFYSIAKNRRISHVGIYIGNGKMIHSPKTGDVVKVTDITTTFWKTRYMVARRSF